jgi:hypothetical protein
VYLSIVNFSVPFTVVFILVREQATKMVLITDTNCKNPHISRRVCVIHIVLNVNS